mmetsp:Transcript_1954/g.7670  ORF Transcript_1954/g.7670 Transcript_1954/m.7670 type:complete len:633 (+) Transcript_1954:1833-3731(+)
MHPPHTRRSIGEGDSPAASSHTLVAPVGGAGRLGLLQQGRCRRQVFNRDFAPRHAVLRRPRQVEQLLVLPSLQPGDELCRPLLAPERPEPGHPVRLPAHSGLVQPLRPHCVGHGEEPCGALSQPVDLGPVPCGLQVRRPLVRAVEHAPAHPAAVLAPLLRLAVRHRVLRHQERSELFVAHLGARRPEPGRQRGQRAGGQRRGLPHQLVPPAGVGRVNASERDSAVAKPAPDPPELIAGILASAQLQQAHSLPKQLVGLRPRRSAARGRITARRQRGIALRCAPCRQRVVGRVKARLLQVLEVWRQLLVPDRHKEALRAGRGGARWARGFRLVAGSAALGRCGAGSGPALAFRVDAAAAAAAAAWGVARAWARAWARDFGTRRGSCSLRCRTRLRVVRSAAAGGGRSPSMGPSRRRRQRQAGVGIPARQHHPPPQGGHLTKQASPQHGPDPAVQSAVQHIGVGVHPQHHGERRGSRHPSGSGSAGPGEAAALRAGELRGRHPRPQEHVEGGLHAPGVAGVHTAGCVGVHGHKPLVEGHAGPAGRQLRRTRALPPSRPRAGRRSRGAAGPLAVLGRALQLSRRATTRLLCLKQRLAQESLHVVAGAADHNGKLPTVQYVVDGSGGCPAKVANRE